MRDYGLVYDDGKKVIAFDNREFPNRAAMERYAQAMDAIAGRELHWRELATEFGIHKLNVGEQARLANWQPRMANAKKPFVLGVDNPFTTDAADSIVDRQRVNLGKPVDRKKLYAEGSKEWQAKHDANAAEAEELAGRERTIRATKHLLDRVRFDPTVTTDVVIQAVQAVRAASTPGSDFDEVKRLVGDAIDAETARNNAKQTALREQIELLQSQLDERPLPEAPALAPKSPSVPYPHYEREVDPAKQMAMIRANRQALGLSEDQS